MELKIRYILLFIIGLLSAERANSQCEIESSFYQFDTYGMSTTIDWNPITSKRVVCNSSDWQPSFYVNRDSLLDVRISGEIFIPSSCNDDDFVGFVFGYKSPNQNSQPNDNRYYLFDWKKLSQYAPEEYGALMAKEGFCLAYLDGVFPNDPISTYRQFWAHQESPHYTVLDTKYGNTLGWEKNIVYSFELIYSYHKILISIDGVNIFEEEGCFEPGLFGLYSFAQSNVEYRNVKYEQYYEINYSSQTEGYCEDWPVYFSFLDTACTYLSPSSVDFEWDFGDGSPTSNELLPTHYFEEPGAYDVELRITNTNNCIDHFYKTIIIDPKPSINGQPEDVYCFVGDAVGFSVDAENADIYQWYMKTEDANYWSKMSNNGYYTGVNTHELRIFNVRPHFDHIKYRCTIIGNCGNQATSQAGELIITGNPVRANLGTSTPAVCELDSTFLYIKLSELYQISSANLSFTYDTNMFEILNFTSYYQSINFQLTQDDNHINIHINTDDIVEVDEAIVAAFGIKALSNKNGPATFSWDHENTYFIDFDNDTIDSYQYNTTILLHLAFKFPYGDTIDICKGSPLSLDEQLFYEINWSTGDHGNDLLIDENGDYWVDLVDRNSCVSSDTFYIVLQDSAQRPSDIIFDRDYYCMSDDSVGITVIGGYGSQLQYAYNGIVDIDSSAYQDKHFIPVQATSFDVFVSWSNSCGISKPVKKEVIVHKTADPDVYIIPSESNSNLGHRIAFTAITQDEGENPICKWYIDDKLKQSGGQKQFSTNELQENQKVSVVLYSDEYCFYDSETAEASIEININSGSDLYVPGIVTPDGDGINDAFKAVFRNSEIYFFILRIYDIQGRLVYETDDVFDNWKGQNVIKNGSMNIYTYSIEYNKDPLLSAANLKRVTGKFLLMK